MKSAWSKRGQEPCSAAVPGCELEHRPGAFPFHAANIHWRRDAARTRRRGRPRYVILSLITVVFALRVAIFGAGV